MIIVCEQFSLVYIAEWGESERAGRLRQHVTWDADSAWCGTWWEAWMWTEIGSSRQRSAESDTAAATEANRDSTITQPCQVVLLLLLKLRPYSTIEIWLSVLLLLCDAMHKRSFCCQLASVHPSVRLSLSYIASRRLKVSSNFFLGLLSASL